MVRRLLPALALLVALAAPAGAHTELVATEPADGATVETSPPQVLLRFGDEVVPAADGITVVGTDGLRADTGEVTKPDDTTIVVGLRPALPAGAYAVEWEILAPDGDVQEGAFTFTVASGPATTTTTAAPTTTITEGSTAVRVPDPPEREEAVDGTSIALVLGGIAVLVAIVVAVLVRRSRREGEQP